MKTYKAFNKAGKEIKVTIPDGDECASCSSLSRRAGKPIKCAVHDMVFLERLLGIAPKRDHEK